MAATSNAAPGPGIATAEDLADQRPPLPVPKACEALQPEAAAAERSPTAQQLARRGLPRSGGESQATVDIWTGMAMGLAARGRLDDAAK